MKTATIDKSGVVLLLTRIAATAILLLAALRALLVVEVLADTDLYPYVHSGPRPVPPLADFLGDNARKIKIGIFILTIGAIAGGVWIAAKPSHVILITFPCVAVLGALPPFIEGEMEHARQVLEQRFK